jgi:hypothetical protein
MTPHHIVPASALQPGLATIVVSLPDRTIRSRALMVQQHDHGVVQVAFASGDVITLMQARSMVGPHRSRRLPRPPRTEAAAPPRSTRLNLILAHGLLGTAPRSGPARDFAPSGPAPTSVLPRGRYLQSI